MTNAPVVVLEDVSKAFGSAGVLQDVTLKIRAGEFLCIVGPNGGGKTTLLKLLLGLIQPDRGRISVLGKSPVRSRCRIGYMPQYARHDPQFPITVMDVVLMGRLDKHWGGPWKNEDKTAAMTALDEVGLSVKANRLFEKLSGGQRQRVLIARALVSDPLLLLLDEPMAYVDVATEAKLYELLQNLNRRMTVLMVSHDLGFVSQHVEKVVCVNRTVVIHTTREITGEMIQDLYGAPVRGVQHNHGWSEGHSHD